MLDARMDSESVSTHITPATIPAIFNYTLYLLFCLFCYIVMLAKLILSSEVLSHVRLDIKVLIL